MATRGRKPQHQLQYQDDSSLWRNAVTVWNSNRVDRQGSLIQARQSKRGMLELFPEIPYRIINLKTGLEVA